MPTIAELLLAYRDRTGASYAEMARKVGDELTPSRMHQLATAPPQQFPKRARTVEALAELLEVPVTTIVLAFAAGLGIPVQQSGTVLEQTLPPGTDVLTDEDRQAVRGIVRALVRARRNALVHHASGSGKTESLMRAAQAADADLALVVSDRPAEGADPADVSAEDFALAARRGDSEGRRQREQQDRDAES
ncbi:hypothetical protein [Geodermatophilus chilensis]|uniref:hypothetical protein n=1 Tax=Geodermatophilus chilensis TaxID=2035835 RepID=UPI000C257F2A|nr:hypothetical protein [Geodermatophilus chilensis]